VTSLSVTLDAKQRYTDISVDAKTNNPKGDLVNKNYWRQGEGLACTIVSGSNPQRVALAVHEIFCRMAETGAGKSMAGVDG